MIYLASQSARRKEILKKMKVKFRVVRSRYQEKPKRGRTPRQLVLEHAVGKAQKAMTKGKKGLVLGADTVVVCGRKVLGKPRNLKQARSMLRLISGRFHYVLTGIALSDLESDRILKGAVRTKVYVRKLAEDEIDHYIRAVHSYDKAGGYAIQMKPKIVTRIQGSYSNVVGLPTELLREMLRKMKK